MPGGKKKKGKGKGKKKKGLTDAQYKRAQKWKSIVRSSSSEEGKEVEERLLVISSERLSTTTTTTTAAAAAAVSAPATRNNKNKSSSRKKRHVGKGMDWVVVIDFECTCEEGSGPFAHEVIEFPAVLVDAFGLRIVDEFRVFVRPTERPVLSDFCTTLTGITQAEVEGKEAVTIDVALARFDAWLRKHDLVRDRVPTRRGEGEEEGKRWAILTDGPWDMQRFLIPECKRKGINLPAYCQQWINLRLAFKACYKSHRQKNINRMLAHFGLVFEGREHSGIDDTRNIARIAMAMLQDGIELIVNSVNDGRVV
jgi:3'-5' exoribonuclease 1